MAPVVVRHRVLGLAQTPLAGVPVVARLVATSSWLSSQDAEVRGADDQVTGDDGRVELPLTPQSELAVDETHYAITVGGSTVYYCVVPDTGPVDLYDILVDPTTLDPSSPSTPSTYQVRAERGAANGYATLDSGGKVPAAQLPASSGGELDADLVTIAGLTPSNNDVLQRKAGAWTNRSPGQLKTDLALTKSDVGLANVSNLAPADLPISTATQAALDALAGGGGDDGGGGGGGIQAFATSGLQTIVIGPCNTSGTWTLCPVQYRVTVPATAGDVLQWSPRLIAGVGGGDAELDVASVIGGVPVRYYSSGTSSQAPNGHGGLYLGGNYANGLNAINWVTDEDDLDSGQVTLALMYRAGGSGAQLGSNVYPGQIDVTNHGQAA